MEIQSIKPFLHYFGNVRERTMRVARSIPPDKLDWSYTPGKFSLGDLLRHIAVTERFMWGENLQGKPSQYKSHGKELADGYENVLALMERLHKECWTFSPALPTPTCRPNAKRPATSKSQSGNGCG
jgi:uncharacterized damage-inducible protein DinB